MSVIDYVSGIIESKRADGVVVDLNGAGVFVFASPSTLAALPHAGEYGKVYTYLDVKEDSMALFGFATRDEQRMFQRLIAISGVGPKSALALLGQMSVSDLTLAIISDDAKRISKTPGLGLKTAQKIILELADKVGDIDSLSKGAKLPARLPGSDNMTQDAIDALITLGYQISDAAKAVSKHREGATTLDELIRLALKETAG